MRHCWHLFKDLSPHVGDIILVCKDSTYYIAEYTRSPDDEYGEHHLICTTPDSEDDLFICESDETSIWLSIHEINSLFNDVNLYNSTTINGNISSIESVNNDRFKCSIEVKDKKEFFVDKNNEYIDDLFNSLKHSSYIGIELLECDNSNELVKAAKFGIS